VWTVVVEVSRSWWALALRGVAAILFGLSAFIWPGLTLAVLILLFGAYVLVDGIFSIVGAVRASRLHERWWPMAVEGVAGIIAGLIAFFFPGITAIALLLLIATWAIVTGIFEIAQAIQLRQVVSNEWLMGLSGLASIVFGILLIVIPAAGALALVWLIGAYALVFGVLLLILAFRLRGLTGKEMGVEGTSSEVRT
jgi:uncharacterized membrane protein HdeD (DUF308 family)